jgi:hypothetical protein
MVDGVKSLAGRRSAGALTGDGESLRLIAEMFNHTNNKKLY